MSDNDFLQVYISTLGLLDEVVKHPKGFENLFLHNDEENLTATKLIDKVFTIQYSEGSGARRESQIIELWQTYLFDIEGTDAEKLKFISKASN